MQWADVLARGDLRVRRLCHTQGLVLEDESHGIHRGVHRGDAIEVRFDHFNARDPFPANRLGQGAGAPLPQGLVFQFAHEIHLRHMFRCTAGARAE
jgi:hypothetical protein